MEPGESLAWCIVGSDATELRFSQLYANKERFSLAMANRSVNISSFLGFKMEEKLIARVAAYPVL